MSPAWIIYAAYALCAVVACVAIVRIIQRRIRERGSAKKSARHDETVAQEARVQELPEQSGPAAQPRAHSALRTDPGSNAAATGELPFLDAEDIPVHGAGDYVLGPLTPALAELLPDTPDGRRALKAELCNAGYYQPHAWHNFAALRYVGVMGTLLLFGAGLLFVPPALEIPWLIATLVVPMLVWALPRVFIRGKAKDRITQIEMAMPDLLDMLHMCVSQGLTVAAALRRIGRELQPVYPALAQELAIVSDQAAIGTLEHALTNFARRVDVPDVNSFTSLLVQTERMGTSVGSALGEYSDSMRETLRQRADTKANQSTFKLLFPTVLCLMPAVYLFLLGPAIVEFSEFMAGDAIPDYQQNIQSFQSMQQADPADDAI